MMAVLRLFMLFWIVVIREGEYMCLCCECCVVLCCIYTSIVSARWPRVYMLSFWYLIERLYFVYLSYITQLVCNISISYYNMRLIYLTTGQEMDGNMSNTYQ